MKAFILFFVLCVFSFSMSIFPYSGSAGGNSSVGFALGHIQFDPGSNVIASYGLMKNGFSFNSSSVTTSFNSFFPVSGTVALNGGTLCLRNDIRFDSGTNLTTFGSIYGHGYKMRFSDSIETINFFGDPDVLEDVTLVFKGDVIFSGKVTFKGNCRIKSKKRCLTLDDSAQISVAEGSRLDLINVSLKGIKDRNIRCLGDTASIRLKRCKLALSDDYVFDTGSLFFVQNVKLTGTNIFSYESSQTSTIRVNTRLKIDHDMTFSYAPPVANRDLFYMQNEKSRLYMNGCTLCSTQTGLRLTRGTLLIDNDVTFSSASNIAGETICFGDGVDSDNDLFIHLLAGSELIVYGGLEYNNVL